MFDRIKIVYSKVFEELYDNESQNSQMHFKL